MSFESMPVCYGSIDSRQSDVCFCNSLNYVAFLILKF